MISRLLGVWNRLPLRVQGWVLSAIPFLAVVVSAGFAMWGNTQRQRAENDVSRHFALVSTLSDLLSSSISAETGMRGFLLSGRGEFLTPFTRSQSRLPTELSQLHALVLAEPGEKPRIEKLASAHRIAALAHQEVGLLQALQSQAGQSANALYPTLARSKTTEDALRVQVRAMRTREDKLLQDRLSEIRAVRARDYWAIYLTLLIGIVSRFVSVYLFNTGIGTRAHKLTENVRRLSQGEGELPHAPTGKPDALGELERELDRAARKLREN